MNKHIWGRRIGFPAASRIIWKRKRCQENIGRQQKECFTTFSKNLNQQGLSFDSNPISQYPHDSFALVIYTIFKN
jgi:hypothetical protein